MGATIPGRCEGLTRRGGACQMAPLHGRPYCFAHDPERSAERAAARLRGGRNRRTPSASGVGAGAGARIQLRDVASCQALLDRVVRDTLAHENSSRRSRTLGYLLGIALKALEIGEAAERLEELERTVASLSSQLAATRAESGAPTRARPPAFARGRSSLHAPAGRPRRSFPAHSRGSDATLA